MESKFKISFKLNRKRNPENQVEKFNIFDAMDFIKTATDL
nr:MAG: hypothetical protein [Microvirus sp.]